METKSQGKNVTSGLLWTFGERISAQLVTTLVSILLARLLDPEHYGIISIVTVFISLCNVFVTSGFGSAVVQKKEADTKDYDTAFLLSFSMAILVYLILFFASPAISSFYQIPALTSVIRVMGLRIPLASINALQHAYIQRQMLFKKFFISTLVGTLISGVVGVAMAFAGFGVWALVGQYLTNTFVNTILLLFISAWRPSFHFSVSRARAIFSFGWKVLATDLVSTLENDIRSLVVGKVFGSADLAFYDQGKKYPALLVTNINASLNKVMLPTYSKSQDNKEELKRMLRKSVNMGIFLLSPILLGFMAVSDTFVHVILTDKWAMCIPYINIFCIAYITRPLETSCHQMVLAVGRSDIALRSMIIINVVALSSVLAAVFVFESVFLIAVGALLVTLTSLVCFMGATSKLIGYRFKEQLADVLPSVFVAILMFLLTKAVSLLPLGGFVLFALQILVGVSSYIVLSFLINKKCAKSFLATVKRLFHKN